MRESILLVGGPYDGMIVEHEGTVRTTFVWDGHWFASAGRCDRQGRPIYAHDSDCCSAVDHQFAE
jgi:hypothetical protein